MIIKNKIACYLLLSLFLYSCSKAESTYVKELDGKSNIDSLIAIGTNHIYEMRYSNEFGVCGREIDALRKYHFLDINDDGLKDLLVLMVFEYMHCGAAGDIGHYLFTAIAQHPNSYGWPAPFKAHSFSMIGSRGISINFEYAAKKKHNLIFKALTYKLNGEDAMCCPSKNVKKIIPISSLDVSFKGSWVGDYGTSEKDNIEKLLEKFYSKEN